MEITKHPIADSDLPFTLDVTGKKLVAQSDKKSIPRGTKSSEIFGFEFPRVIEGHDIMLCDLITVHYTNTEVKTKQKSVGFNKCVRRELVDGGAKVRFYWEITKFVSMYVGSLSFSVHLTCYDENDAVVWNYPTHNYTKISIGESEDHAEEVLDDYPPDIIATWDSQVQAAVARADALISPTVEVSNIPGGHLITITDQNGVSMIEVLDGEKGDPFVYSDFTEEQLAGLIGPQGPEGPTVIGAHLIGDPGEDAPFVAIIGAQITEVI